MVEEQKYNAIDTDDKSKKGDGSAVPLKETKDDVDASMPQEMRNDQ